MKTAKRMPLSPKRDNRLRSLAAESKQSESRRFVLVPWSDPGFRTVPLGRELACGWVKQRGGPLRSVISGDPGWRSNQHGVGFSYGLTSVPSFSFQIGYQCFTALCVSGHNIPFFAAVLIGAEFQFLRKYRYDGTNPFASLILAKIPLFLLP